MAKAKEAWEEGTVFARHTDENGFVTYQEHRAWNMTGFCKKAAERAEALNIELRKKSKSKDVGEAKFERITEDDYKKALELQRRHKK